MKQALHLQILSIILTLLSSSCAYRFTNLHQQPPEGIKSIAIESVYDTSQKVRPHEILWESLQRAFAANGRLYVTSVDKADAYIQTTISKATSGQSKPIETSNNGEDPTYTKNNPPLPSAYRKLTEAAVLADNENQGLVVHVKVWHLRTKKILMEKKYKTGSGNYPILDNTTIKENQYLRSEETFKNHFKKISNNISGRIVRDLLRKS